MNTERIDLLKDIFANVNTWLHFAEAKNAALIAFNVALLSAIVGSDNLTEYTILFAVIAIGLVISTSCGIWSFKPINHSLNATRNTGQQKNLLHFAYIATLEEAEFLKQLYTCYWEVPNIDVVNIPQLEKDYCEEIVANARITMRKQKCFKNGFNILIFVIVAVVLLFVWA